MGFADQYLDKQKGFSPYFADQPSQQLRYAVVIPAYREPDLTQALQALWDCARPYGHVEVIVVVNSPEHAPLSVKEASHHTLESASAWIREHQDPGFRYLLMDKTDLPDRDAGVGLARKTGMDEALVRFNRISIPGGFILSFDADSRCDSNYFTAIESTIQQDPTLQGFDVYFEHPLEGNDFPEKVYRGITGYELHLRYLNLFMRFTGFPFAHHTVGSCFGVRAETYAAQGGMSKRKAGEDFYFLHKIIPLGHFTDITGTRVIPSPRASDRVPFGTGVSIGKFLSSETEDMMTYSPDCFLLLRSLFKHTGGMYKRSSAQIMRMMDQFPEPLHQYLSEVDALNAINEINANCRSVNSFTHRFYRWFDAFRIVKFLNYASRSRFGQVPVQEAALRFLEVAGYEFQGDISNTLGLLKIFRELERGSMVSGNQEADTVIRPQ